MTIQGETLARLEKEALAVAQCAQEQPLRDQVARLFDAAVAHCRAQETEHLEALLSSARRDALAEIARLQSLIVTYCHAHMDRVLAEEGSADSEQLAELRRVEASAFNGLANEMIDVESGNAFPVPTLP